MLTRETLAEGAGAGQKAALIDPVREQVDRDAALVEELGLRLTHTLETHVHADHVTGSGPLRDRLGSRAVVSARGGAACADRQVDDGDVIEFGKDRLEVRATPGHTQGCVTYVTGDRRMAFTGDALFVRGTGRTDFQQGDAHQLYRSIHDRIFSLPDDTLVYPGHDYKGHSVTTVGEEKRLNPRVGGGRSEEEFVAIMEHLQLAPPRRLAGSLPANLECGHTPAQA